MNALSFIDPKYIISAFGLLGVVAAVFMETGCFFGFFFPGDSLLFTAGLLASQHYLPVAWLAFGVFLAAVAGDSTGYAFGTKVGPALFAKDDSIFFNKRHIVRAQHFYEKYGVKTIVLARFVPVVRTFAPIVAGVGEMRYGRFFAWNVVGGLAWTLLLVGLGYGFGSVIPDPDRYVLPAVAIIIILSVMPALRQIAKGGR
jgi:membrane-associated protein